MYIEQVNSPQDIKQFSAEQLRQLAGEVRNALLTKLSAHGGHVGPNLGMVEATIALHYVFNSPTDKMVYDVSHQSYTHKMLTGRKDAFLNPEDYDVVSGYTNPREAGTIFHYRPYFHLCQSGLRSCQSQRSERRTREYHCRDRGWIAQRRGSL